MISVPHLVLVLAIVLVIFGAKKLRNIGGDLGGAIKNFRSSVRDGEGIDAAKADTHEQVDHAPTAHIIDAEIVAKDRDRV